MTKTNEKAPRTLSGWEMVSTIPEGVARPINPRWRSGIEFSFFVPGDPQGKGRPRDNTKTGVHYTPSRTKAYERLIKTYFLCAGGSMLFPEGSPVALEVIAFFAIPKSFAKWRRKAIEDGAVGYVMKKPDFDNIEKVVADALNGLAYHDDAQIVGARCRKIYGVRPGLLVRLVGLVDPIEELRPKRGGKK